MLQVVNKDIKCPSCEFDLLVNAISSVNVTLNPELRKMLLDETLFEFECKNCCHKFKVFYPFLYHDMVNKFMIYFVPEPLKNAMNFDFIQISTELKTVHKRIVSNLSTFKEEIFIFENQLSDSVVYAIKFALEQIMKTRFNDPCVKGYFYKRNKDQGDLNFVFFSGEKVLYKKINREVYEKIYSLSLKRRKKSKSENFVFIDDEWTSKVVNEISEAEKSYISK